jgi:hypothetical protein
MATMTLVLSSETNHTTKKRLKAILNMNKLVEVIVIMYALVRLTIFPSPYVTKEVYIGRILHAILFIIQGQAYTRFSWDSETIAPSVHHNYQQQQQQYHEQQQRMATTMSKPGTTTTTTPVTTGTDNHGHYSWNHES